MTYILLTISLATIMWLYLGVARRLKWVDHPNHRSSHFNPTIVGGGIILPIGILSNQLIFQNFNIHFVFAFIVLAAISFIDDIKGLPAVLRLVAQIGCVYLSLIPLSSDLTILVSIAVIVLYVGWLNAFNFMDGINGISGMYALVTFGTLTWLSTSLLQTEDSSILLVSALCISIFGVFNFRKKAICFAGDVGAISIAFVAGFFLIKLIMLTGKWEFLLFISVFTIDAGITVVERLIRRENIFKAHRTHLYQYLANELRIPHMLVSTSYAVIQLVLNISVILVLKGEYVWRNLFYLVISLTLPLAYLFIKHKVVRTEMKKAE